MKNLAKGALERIGNADAILLVPVIGLITLDVGRRLAVLVTEGLSHTDIDSYARLVLVGGELFIALALLWATAPRWAKRATPILALGAFRAFVSLCTGWMSFQREPIPRTESALSLAFIVVAAILAAPYMSRKPNDRERMALVALIFCGLPAIVLRPQPLVVVVSATVGVTFLGAARMAKRHARSHEP